ncbi:MAG: ATP-binding cassette domain-containing protein [Bacteroidota bacterium]|nr:ATP-binding cassette domain-containing protein [Bacteroidota bacterium]
MNQNETILRVKNLSKSFGEKQVLSDINIEVLKGETMVIIGMSGSGKSVLIKCLIGLITPDTGEINILNNDLLSLKKKALNTLRTKLGFLFQSAALYDSMTVQENLAFPMRNNFDLSKAEKLTAMEKVLEEVGLAGTLQQMPAELSGGMRKRLGLARTLIMQPEFIFYDEPTTGLDPITSKEISELILQVQEKYNTSSILITHDMACAKLTANRMIVLKDGKIADEGNYESLAKSPISWIQNLFQ